MIPKAAESLLIMTAQVVLLSVLDQGQHLNLKLKNMTECMESYVCIPVRNHK